MSSSSVSGGKKSKNTTSNDVGKGKRNEPLEKIQKSKKKTSKNQEKGFQAIAKEDIEKKIKELFDLFDSNHDDMVSWEELKNGLSSWGVKISKKDKPLFLSSFPYAENSTRQQFHDILLFFIHIRQNFSKFDVDKSNTISRKELDLFLNAFEYKFDSQFLTKTLSIYDVDKSGELEWNEVVELMLYLNYLHRVFVMEDKDNSGILDPPELQSLLRTLDLHVSVKETEYFFNPEKISKTASSSKLDFSTFVSLLSELKENLANVREEVNKSKERVKSPTGDTLKLSSIAPSSSTYKDQLTKNQQFIQEIRQNCTPPNGKYEDPEFSTDVKVLFPTNHEQMCHVIKSWKRIEDFGQNAALFKNGAEEGDIIQGDLGDCWFLSALSVLASRGTSTIQDLFVEVHPREGVVQCKFFKNGKWIFVTTDDRIPCNNKGFPCFGSCKDPSELWVPLVEKCYAKIHGSYEVIESGSINDALVDFTGETSEVVIIKKEESLWKKMLENLKSQNLMGCAAQTSGTTVEEASPLGILQLHAYAIVNIVEVSGIKLIQLRNPWGRYEWTGRWSDGSKEWTPELLKQLNYTFADDGTFWMEFSDFCVNFTKLYVLRCFSGVSKEKWHCKDDKGKWKKKSAGGCLSNNTWSINPQYYLKTEEDTEVFVSLKQPDQRLRGKEKEKYAPIGITVLLKGDGHDNKPKTKLNGKSDLVVISPFYAGREISLEWAAIGSVHYVIIPSYYSPGIESDYWINIYTRSKVNIKKIKSKPESSDHHELSHAKTTLTPVSADETILSIHSAWITGKTAGGCPNHTSWITSPQFILTVPSKTKVEFSLSVLTSTPTGKHPPYGVFVFKAEPAKKRKFVASDVVHQSKFTTSQVNNSEVILPPGSYNVLCCTLDPDVDSTFELSVKGNFQDTSQLFELNSETDWQKTHIEGEWRAGVDGGSSNNKETWMNNPKFVLDPVGTGKVNLKIVLTSVQVSGAIGFYVFRSKDGKTPTELIGKGAFGKPAANGRAMSTENFVLDAVAAGTTGVGYYLVMPTTFQPKCHATFNLTAYSDGDCTLKVL